MLVIVFGVLAVFMLVFAPVLLCNFTVTWLLLYPEPPLFFRLSMISLIWRCLSTLLAELCVGCA